MKSASKFSSNYEQQGVHKVHIMIRLADWSQKLKSTFVSDTMTGNWFENIVDFVGVLYAIQQSTEAPSGGIIIDTGTMCRCSGPVIDATFTNNVIQRWRLRCYSSRRENRTDTVSFCCSKILTFKTTLLHSIYFS